MAQKPMAFLLETRTKEKDWIEMKTPVYENTLAAFKDAETAFMLRGKIEAYSVVLESLRAIVKPSKQIQDFTLKLEKQLTELTAK